MVNEQLGSRFLNWNGLSRILPATGPFFHHPGAGYSSSSRRIPHQFLPPVAVESLLPFSGRVTKSTNTRYPLSSFSSIKLKKMHDFPLKASKRSDHQYHARRCCNQSDSSLSPGRRRFAVWKPFVPLLLESTLAHIRYGIRRGGGVWLVFTGTLVEVKFPSSYTLQSAQRARRSDDPITGKLLILDMVKWMKPPELSDDEFFW